MPKSDVFVQLTLTHGLATFFPEGEITLSAMPKSIWLLSVLACTGLTLSALTKIDSVARLRLGNAGIMRL